MEAATQKLYDQLEDTHDFQYDGPYSSGGLEIHSTSTCCVCGLKWYSSSDDQNQRYVTRFTTIGGDELSLRQAAERCA